MSLVAYLKIWQLSNKIIYKQTLKDLDIRNMNWHFLKIKPSGSEKE